MKMKCLVLVSGGLDSQLAVGLMLRHGIDVEAVSFFSPFSGGMKEGRMGYWVSRTAAHFKVKMHYVFLRDTFLSMVRCPQYGYGAGINPCIDCKILMLREARALCEKIGATCVATGEVVGQRPMSQIKQALAIIEKNSGLEGRIVRPLSGKILEATIPEREGVLKRELLCDISGRARSAQVELAREFGIQEYPQPAGGCILTDSHYALKMRDAFQYGVTSEKEYIALQCGRLYRMSPNTKALLGRNARECEMLQALCESDDFLFQLAGNRMGPLLLYKGPADQNAIYRAAQIVKHFSKFKSEECTDIEYWKKKSRAKERVRVSPISESELNALLIA
jgi:tRNA U34 2-thiouridine synthase MnmA/TrmU